MAVALNPCNARVPCVTPPCVQRANVVNAQEARLLETLRAKPDHAAAHEELHRLYVEGAHGTGLS